MIKQKVIPVARSIKDFEEAIQCRQSMIILLESHIAQLTSLVALGKRYHKEIIVHSDLVQGLRADESGAQFLCQMIKPSGIISTHSNVIKIARKHDILAIQRIFLLDSQSMETSCRIVTNSNPNYIEVLPGIIPSVIKELTGKISLPILAGGFIRNINDVRTILEAGAKAVTTSHKVLWDVI